MTHPKALTVSVLVANMFMDVTKFNANVTSLPIPERPKTLGNVRLRWAVGALNEEVQEFIDATVAGDVVEAADALVDLVYFALGRLTEMGVPAVPVWHAVQLANMQKEQGQLSKRPGSKGHDAVKPAGWTAPDHDWLLDFNTNDIAVAYNWRNLSPVLKRVSELRVKKGKDYNAGPQLHDYFPYGHYSYAQMLHIKTTRVQSLLAVLAAGGTPQNEGLADTLDDLINYTVFYREALDEGRVPTAGAQ